MRRLFDIALCVGIGLAASAADLSFDADAWKVDYVASGSVLTLTHPASGTVIEGELSVDGDAKLGAATNRLVLTDDKGRIVGGVTFPRSGDRIALLLFSDAASAPLFFEGSIRYRADALACQSTPGADRVLSLAVGDADSLLNNMLYSPAQDEAVALRGEVVSLTSVAAGRHGLEFALDAKEPVTAQIEFTVERDYCRTRWYPNYRPGAPLPAREWLARQKPPATGRNAANERRCAETMRTLAGFPGVRPAALRPPKGPLPIWDLAMKRPFGQMHLVALFNWADSPAEIEVAWDDLGEDAEHGFIAYELWNAAWHGVTYERLTVQVPPKDVRLFILQPKAGHPQFLAPEGLAPVWPLKAQTWTEDVLKTTVALTAGHTHTLRYAIPDSFTFDALRPSANITSSKVRLESGGKVLAVMLASPKGGDVDFELAFK